MRTFYTILFIISCLFYSCLETGEFEVPLEYQNKFIFKNPIRFDQLAVGQKTSYASYSLRAENGIVGCQPDFDTLTVEIIAVDTNGYLVKEILKDGFQIRENDEWKTVDTLTFYLKYLRLTQMDTLEGIPTTPGGPAFLYLQSQNVEQEEDIYGINSSYIFGKIGTRIYLNEPLAPFEEITLDDICDFFFLTPKDNAPFPFEYCDGNYSEPGILNNYSFNEIEYGQLLLEAHDFGYQVDGLLYNFGYTYEYGMIFTGLHRASGKFDEAWHIIPDN